MERLTTSEDIRFWMSKIDQKQYFEKISKKVKDQHAQCNKYNMYSINEKSIKNIRSFFLLIIFVNDTFFDAT